MPARVDRLVGETLDVDNLDIDGARIYACLLSLAGHPESAQYWWQLAAGAGDRMAAYCLHLHHECRGELREAEHWANETVRGRANVSASRPQHILLAALSRHVPAPVGRASPPSRCDRNWNAWPRPTATSAASPAVPTGASPPGCTPPSADADPPPGRTRPQPADAGGTPGRPAARAGRPQDRRQGRRRTRTRRRPLLDTGGRPHIQSRPATRRP
ncbi:hypothetical protein NKH77_01795 [Streptomyces sp. M19]